MIIHGPIQQYNVFDLIRAFPLLNLEHISSTKTNIVMIKSFYY